MSTMFWLTDEDADIVGYKRLKLGGKSDCPSLVQAITSTVAGPATGVQMTNGGAALAWISDPLNGTALSAATWTIQVWAQESSALANTGLRFEVFRFTIDGGEASSVVDDSVTTALSVVTRSSGRTTPAATATVLNDGDRIVFKVLIHDAGGTMAAAYMTTLSYNGQRPRAEGDSLIV